MSGQRQRKNDSSVIVSSYQAILVWVLFFGAAYASIVSHHVLQLSCSLASSVMPSKMLASSSRGSSSKYGHEKQQLIDSWKLNIDFFQGLGRANLATHIMSHHVTSSLVFGHVLWWFDRILFRRIFRQPGMMVSIDIVLRAGNRQ